jgi:hypothetical protein
MIAGQLILGAFFGLLAAAAAVAAGYSLIVAFAVYAVAGAAGTLMFAAAALALPGRDDADPLTDA